MSGKWHAGPERSTGSQPLRLEAAKKPLERSVFTLFPNTRLPRTFLLIMPSLWRISGQQRHRTGQGGQAIPLQATSQPSPGITCSKGLHDRLVGRTTWGVGPMAQLVTVDDICPQALKPLSY